MAEGKKVVELSEENFKEAVLDFKGIAVLDFWATWCGPCKMVAPVLEELAGELPDVKFYKVDVDDSPDLAGEYGIRSIPCLILFKEGKEVERAVGAQTKAQIKDWIAQSLATKDPESKT